jgi:hypothetical protein
MNPDILSTLRLSALSAADIEAWAIVADPETGFPTVAERMIHGCTCSEALAEIDEWAVSFGESEEHSAARTAIRIIYGV